jgi:hypothetical protein
MLFISILLVSCSSTNHNYQVAPQHALHMMQLLDEEPVSFSTSRAWGVEIEIYTVIKKEMKNRLE